MLRRAWNLSPDSASSLIETITSLQADAQEQLGQDINSSASNSHSATSNQPGANRITDQETVRGWNLIVVGYKQTRQYLLNCCKYGLDAFTIQCRGCFPNPLPAAITPPEDRVIVDDHSRWENLCDLEEIAASSVVGKVVGDEAIYLWLLNNPNLLNQSGNVSSSQGNYSSAIVGRAGGGF